jgi:hypothetical protein
MSNFYDETLEAADRLEALGHPGIAQDMRNAIQASATSGELYALLGNAVSRALAIPTLTAELRQTLAKALKVVDYRLSGGRGPC